MLKKIQDSLNHRFKSLIEKWSWRSLKLDWKLSSGLSVIIDNRAEWVIYNDIFVDGEYDVAIEQALLHPKNKRNFVLLDIGANVGFFTLKAIDSILNKNLTDVNIHTILVEGSPSIYKRLKLRLERQSILQDKIKIVHGLVGDLQGESRILESEFHVMNSVASSDESRGTLVSYVNLNSLYLDEFKIDLLKCDIEGSEEKFIENYTEILKRTNFAVFELHPNLCNTSKCFKMLNEVGFSHYKILRENPSFRIVLFSRQDLSC